MQRTILEYSKFHLLITNEKELENERNILVTVNGQKAGAG